MSDRPSKILLVEDNPGDARLLREALKDVANYHFDLQHVERLSQALERLRGAHFDVVLLDLSLPDGEGLDNLAAVGNAAPGVPILVLTGLDDEEVAVQALRVGAQDYLVKGQADGSSVVRAIRYARERKSAEEQIQRQLERISALRDINLAITSTLDLTTILDVLLKKIDLSFNYAVSTTVRLFNPQTGFLEPVACRNLNPNEWNAEEWKSGGDIPKMVFENRAPLTLVNIQSEPRIKNHEMFKRQGLFSYLGIPLIANGRPLGVLGLYTKKEHRFSDQEVDFFNTLAGQAAVAIQNSQLHEETKQQAQALEKSNKIKDEFLSVTSHELRTPLIAILGYARLLEDESFGKLHPDQLKAARVIKERSEDLLVMIRGILEVTKLEAGAMSVEKERVDVRRLLEELGEFYDVSLKSEVSICWDYDQHLPEILTDGTKLKQILQNLINNAIKFTHHGHVTISVRFLTERHCVEFKVTDTGIGISREIAPIIFEKFRQADSSEARAHEGIGLGLYIVKQFTELLGGSIAFETEMGQGTVFTVVIPEHHPSEHNGQSAPGAKLEMSTPGDSVEI
jgi:signal transduction histidine kinase/DNA-binding NarL/FixJ family response regulator